MMEENYEPEAILKNHIQSDQGQAIQQLLVKCKNRTCEDASWMNYFDFVHQFSDFSLKDKAVSHGDGIVRDQIMNPNPKVIPLKGLLHETI